MKASQEIDAKKAMHERKIVNDEMRRIAAGIEGAVAGLTLEQLAWSPAGKWSTAQILEHLAITYGSTARLMRKLVDSGSAGSAKATAKKRLAAFVVTSVGFFPPGRQAPAFTLPTGLPPSESIQTIRQNLADMDAAMASAEQRFGARMPLGDHPVLGPLRIRQWRRFHEVHTRNHLKQIARLREQQGIRSN